MHILLVTVSFYSSFGWSTAQALKRCGHDVTVFDYRKGLRLRVPLLKNLTIRSMNDRLLDRVKSYKPDLIFVEKGELLYHETLKEARRLGGCPLINWFPDPRPMAYENVATSLSTYDYFFTKNPYWNRKLSEAGYSNVHFLAHAYDLEIQTSMDLTEQEKNYFGSDLSFIGSMYPYRAHVMEQIKNVDFKIWGPGWNNLPKNRLVRQNCQFRDIRGMDHTRVINASLINLNLHHYDDIDGINQRLFDIAGSGGFQMVDEKTTVSRYLKPDEEIVCYRSIEELNKKVRYYLDHPEERVMIQENGYKRIKSGNTYDDRMKEMFEMMKM